MGPKSRCNHPEVSVFLELYKLLDFSPVPTALVSHTPYRLPKHPVPPFERCNNYHGIPQWFPKNSSPLCPGLDVTYF